MNELYAGNPDITVKVLNKKSIFIYGLLHPLMLLGAAINKRNTAKEILRISRIRSINKCGAEIIHFEFSGIGINYLDTINYLNGRKVVSCRGTGEKLKLLVHDERKEKLRKLLMAADAVHCVSQDMCNTILPYTENAKKLFINFPSIDTRFFRNEAIRKKLPVKTILSVGRLTFAKGYSTGLLAISILKQSGVKFKWIIAGGGSDYEQIVFQIHALQLQDDVILAGPKTRSEVKLLMQQADIFFLSSVYEGIANVVLEAMSMELPVVSTRAGGMAEVITHEKNGLLSNIYDHNSIAENLLRLCNDEALCELLGKNARTRVAECFNIEAQINKFEEVYQRLVQ